MMSIYFDTVHAIFENARSFDYHHHRLPAYPPVDELITEIGRWYNALHEEEDDYVASLRMRIWRLRTTVLLSLLPFDDQELMLQKQIQSLREEAAYVPFLIERAEQLSRIVEYLLNNPNNPKREIVYRLLSELPRQGSGAALIITFAGRARVGWSHKQLEEIRQIAPRCCLVASKRSLSSRAYQRIILPAGGRACSFLYEIYHCFRAAKLDVITYKRETIIPPERKSLPKGTLIRKSASYTHDSKTQDDIDDINTKVEEWVHTRFWDSIRGPVSKEALPEGEERERQILLKARLVVLANGTKVYLRDDMEVIEISELMDGSVEKEDLQRRFTRTAVNELKEDDLIVLRTCGSGDYLIDVANSLMDSDGKQSLRSDAFEWKSILRMALEEHGSKRIAQLLAAKGHKLSNHRYIWNWTTDIVMRPRLESCFFELISILDDLGYRLRDQDPITVAESHWCRMDEIHHYHRMAGNKIRKALLRRLRKMIEQRVTIDDAYHLSLPDVDAGEISVFRVRDVDSQTFQIPYNHIGIIRELEERNHGTNDTTADCT